MVHGTPSEQEVADTLSHLKLSTKTPQKPAAKPKSKPVAESWDDEDLSGSDTETEDTSTNNPSSLSRSSTKETDPLSPISSTASTASDIPCPPPPTPASPLAFDYPDNSPYPIAGGHVRGGGGGSGSAEARDSRRPDKTTAVAGRLIAGALGVRAPKRTDEEREYDRLMRDKERKRRDEERSREQAEKQAAEDRKRAIWED